MGTLETSPGDIAQKAANDMGRLLKQEIDGATERVASDAATLAPAVGFLAAGGLATFFGLETLVLAPSVKHPVRATVTGILLLGAGVAAGVAAYRALPETLRGRLADGVSRLAARSASQASLR